MVETRDGWRRSPGQGPAPSHERNAPRLIVQYLEGGPHTASFVVSEVIDRLEEALRIAPITDVCVGWQLPRAVVDAVADCLHRQTSVSLWLWHPLLSGD